LKGGLRLRRFVGL